MEKHRQGLTNLIVFLVVLSVGLFFFFGTYNKEKQILNEGIEIRATVYRNFKGKTNKGGTIWISEAVYEVEEKKYKFNIEAKVPIGKTFMLKYLPEDPDHTVLMNPDEFKGYPYKY